MNDKVELKKLFVKLLLSFSSFSIHNSSFSFTCPPGRRRQKIISQGGSKKVVFVIKYIPGEKNEV